MKYQILFAPEAVEDFKLLEARIRADVRQGIEKHLRHDPTKTSKSRIKRLRGLSRPQFRLRIGDEIRVFYDISDQVVEILAIVPKSKTQEWLKRYGESDEGSRPV